MKIYLVVGTYADYEGTSHWNVAAYEDKTEAELRALACNHAMERIGQANQQILEEKERWRMENPGPVPPVKERKGWRKVGDKVRDTKKERAGAEKFHQEYVAWCKEVASLDASMEAKFLTEEDLAFKKSDAYYEGGYYEVEELELR